MKRMFILPALFSGFSYGAETTPYQELVEKYKQCIVKASTQVEQSECLEEYLIWGFEGCQTKATEKQEREAKECRADRERCLDRSQGKEGKEKECYVREKECHERNKEVFQKSERECREVSDRDSKSLDHATSAVEKTISDTIGVAGMLKKK